MIVSENVSDTLLLTIVANNYFWTCTWYSITKLCYHEIISELVLLKIVCVFYIYFRYDQYHKEWIFIYYSYHLALSYVPWYYYSVLYLVFIIFHLSKHVIGTLMSGSWFTSCCVFCFLWHAIHPLVNIQPTDRAASAIMLYRDILAFANLSKNIPS